MLSFTLIHNQPYQISLCWFTGPLFHVLSKMFVRQKLENCTSNSLVARVLDTVYQWDPLMQGAQDGSG